MKRKSILTAAAILFLALGSLAQTSSDTTQNKKGENKAAYIFDLGDFSGETKSEAGTFKDSRDGKTYKTVKIGTQTWMAENLAYQSSNCWVYNNDKLNIAKYGYLYTWENAKTISPSGWHLPSDEEWNTLINSLGGTDVAGAKMKALSGFIKNGNGTNESGFNALPGGYYDSFFKVFTNIDRNAGWWSSTEKDAVSIWIRNLTYIDGVAYRGSASITHGYAVRCIKD